MPVKPHRVAWTLLLALAAAGVCLYLGTPLPWMIGPLLVTACASVAGAPTASWQALGNLGQWVIATALGLYFTPQVTALVGGLWWVIVLAVLWALLLGLVFGAWLHRVNAHRLADVTPQAMRATSYFAGAIGGASEMTLLAERHQARTDLVAAAHGLRLLLVTVTVPFAMQFSGLSGLDPSPTVLRTVQWPGLFALAAATGLGALVLQRLGRPNAWFMGALLVSMGLTMAGLPLSGVPAWLTNAAQLLIAVSLGVRFSRAFLHAAPRWLGAVVVGTAGMIALCAGFAAVLGWATGLPLATLILGTAPGGIAEMAITAKVLQLGVPVVTAFQVCRLIAVLLVVAPLYRWFYPPDAA